MLVRFDVLKDIGSIGAILHAGTEVLINCNPDNNSFRMGERGVFRAEQFYFTDSQLDYRIKEGFLKKKD